MFCFIVFDNKIKVINYQITLIQGKNKRNHGNATIPHCINYSIEHFYFANSNLISIVCTIGATQ